MPSSTTPWTPSSLVALAIGLKQARDEGMRILLVDDDDNLRLVVRTVVGFSDHAVVGEASDIAQALRALPEVRPDVIVTDLVMGGRAGADALIAELKAAAPDARIIVFSGYPITELTREPAGIDRYILKGASLDDLIEALDSLGPSGRR